MSFTLHRSRQSADQTGHDGAARQAARAHRRRRKAARLESRHRRAGVACRSSACRAAGRLSDAARAAAVRQHGLARRATASRWRSRRSPCAWRAILPPARRRPTPPRRSRRSRRRSKSPISIRSADAGQSRRRARRRHLPAPRRACAATRAGSATSGLTSRLIRRGAEAARSDRSGSADRQAARYRRPCRQRRGGIRRETVGRRRHHHRLDHAAGHSSKPDETEIAHAIDPIGEVSVRFSRN